MLAETDITEEGAKQLKAILDSRYGNVKVIAVKGNPRAIIVKTTNEIAPLLREASGGLQLGGRRLETVLTSGAVGKLKKRALQARADDKVP